MKSFWRVARASAAAGIALVALVGTPSAQPYGGRDYGYGGGREYRDRDYDDEGYGGRGRGRDYGEREYGRGGYGRGGGFAFDEGEYLRCNPDVRRAVRNGQMESGAAHFQQYGRREGRRLSC